MEAQEGKSAISPRQQILDEALKIIMKDRNSVYGNPEDNFKDIADLWTAYKNIKFTKMDVVIMNMLIKVARLKVTPEYHDGLVDIAGYAGCGGDIQAGLRRDNDPHKISSLGSMQAQDTHFQKSNQSR